MTTAVAEPTGTDKRAIPETVQRRMTRGRKQMRRGSSLRRLNYKFWRGETYWQVNSLNQLVNQSTVSWLLGGEKPNYRIRNKYPFIAMIVAAKVSAATQRIPGYQVMPSKLDPESAQAAALSEKVLLWGYDEWRVRRVTMQCFTHAFVGGEGFAYPYFDTSVGPYYETVDEQTGAVSQIGQGEIRTKILSGNEVYWEPGVDFDQSRWYCIEQARPLEEIRAMPGFLGGEVSANAAGDSDAPSDADKDNLGIVTEYFERPSADFKRGRKLVMASGRQILPEGDYPCQDPEGQVLDEPVLVRISYTVEVDDRDRSLVEHLIDLQRTISDCWNKLLEWKNRCLNPQMLAPRGSNVSRGNDEPGIIRYYNPTGAQPPKWEQPPAVPRELFTMLDKAIEHIRAIAADVDVQPDPRLTAQTAQSAIEQNQLRWQSFLGDGAEFHSRLARRYLYLVQRHYTEPRLLKIQGMFGPDLTPGFRGADLLGQADVRVSPDSLASKSRQQIIQDTLLFADRGWITPQAAMATIQGGVAEKLGEAWQFHVARANFIIQTLKRGPDALYSLPDRQPFPGEEPPVGPDNQPLLVGPDGEAKVPGFMPRPFDNVQIQKQVFETWMLTTDWDHLPAPMQHSALLYYQALLDLEQRQALRAAEQEAQMAAAQGMQNAARPQDKKMQPSQRMPDRQGDTSAVSQ